MDLDDIAAELYGLPLDAFVRERDERASLVRKNKQRELANAIKALVKPTVGAWAVNSLVRSQPQLIKKLLALGEKFRSAQQQLDGKQLRQLSGDRRDLLAQLSEQLKQMHLSESAEQEALETLGAAVADAGVAEQVVKGQLTRPLQQSGFGDMEGLLAASTGPSRAADPVSVDPPPAPEEPEVAPPEDSEVVETVPPSTEEPEEPEEPEETPEAEPVESAAARKRRLRVIERRLQVAEDALEDARSERDIVKSRVASLRKRLREGEDKLEEALLEVAEAESVLEQIQQELEEARHTEEGRPRGESDPS